MEIQGLNAQAVSPPAIERTRDIGAPAKTEESAPAARAPVFDEYVPEDPAVKRSAGIYRVAHDDDGTPRIRFESPEDGEDSPAPEKTSGKPAPESRAETTTCNTDEVDRELENLREKRDTLSRQLRDAAGDPEKAGKLERELRQVEQELSQKDNDAYRRQHAKFS